METNFGSFSPVIIGFLSMEGLREIENSGET
jgi:hypothetical protein